MDYSYEYPRAMNTVDMVVFNNTGDKVLLIKRLNEPYKDCWAFPGGFIEMDEDLVDSALRELEEETNLANITLKQFKSYGKPGRDPRGRNIATVFYGNYKGDESDAIAGDDAANAEWFSSNNLPSLGFDHEIILNELINSID